MISLSANYIFQYWYISPIAALSSFFGPRTKYRWAPLTCIALILLVPAFRPPSHLGIYAITITTVVDVQLIYLTLKDEQTAASGLWSGKLGPAAPFMVAGTITGAAVLYFLGCRIGLIAFVVTAVILSVSLLVLEDSGSEEEKHLRKAAGLKSYLLFPAVFVLTVSSFGLPALILLHKNAGTHTRHRESFEFAFRNLFFVTLLAAVLDTLVSVQKFGYSSFPYPALMFASVGAFVGRRIFSFLAPAMRSSFVLHLYLFLLLFFSAVSLYYIVTVVI